MIRRYDFIVRVDESSGGYYVSFDDIAHLIPHKGNDLPEDAADLLVLLGDHDGFYWREVYRSTNGWIQAGGEDPHYIDLSRVTHWMRVPEVET